MTISEAKAKLVAWCDSQVGYHEGANNWNKYAPKWTQAGGWNAQNQPWCDIFVDCGFIECFGLDAASRLTYQRKGSFSALCRISAQYYKENDAFFKSPEVGDQVFFYVDGAINHTGIVVDIHGGLIDTIEGNSSDMVAKRTYTIGVSNIAGYGRPNWGIFSGNLPDTPTTGEDTGSTDAPDDPPEEKPKVEGLPMLKQGDTGEVVRAAQFLLNGRKCSVGIWGADGDFGPQTRAAVLAFQRRNSLEPDGIIGPETWAALLGV